MSLRKALSDNVYAVFMSKQDRVPVAVRLSKTGLAEIDQMAEAEERDRSSMIRVLLREAVAHRKQGSRR